MGNEMILRSSIDHHIIDKAIAHGFNKHAAMLINMGHQGVVIVCPHPDVYWGERHRCVYGPPKDGICSLASVDGFRGAIFL